MGIILDKLTGNPLLIEVKEADLDTALKAKVNQGKVAGIITTALPTTGIITDKVYEYAGVQGVPITGGTIKDTNGATITTLQNGDSIWYDDRTGIWYRIPFQSLTNYVQFTSDKLLLKTNIAYEHIRGDIELFGEENTFYPRRGVMFYEQMTEKIIFNVIQLCAVVTNCTSLQLKIYLTDAPSRFIGGLTPIYSKTILEDELVTNPKGLMNIKLTENINVPANKYVQIGLWCVDGLVPFIYVKSFTDISSAPIRHGHYYTTLTTAQWGNNWTASTAYISTFRLLMTNRNVEFVDLNKKIILPSVINIAVGQELNLWKNSINRNYKIFAESTIGADRERCFRYTPVGAASSDLYLFLGDKGELIDSKKITVKSIAANAGSGTKQILMIGDSILDGGCIPYEINSLIIAGGGFTPLFIGTKTTSGILHEGIPGWSFSTFLGNTSPFWDGSRINFKNYMATNSNFGGSDIIDIITIQLGTNDILTYRDPNKLYTVILPNIKSFIDKIQNATYGYPDCKIILALPPLQGFDMNGFATSYLSTKRYLEYENYMRLLWYELVKTYDESRYSANISISINGIMLDREYGFDYGSFSVSARNATLISEQTNGVHPNQSGELQIADAMYSAILAVV